MQSPFKHFTKKNKVETYFYIWVLLTVIDAICLAISMAFFINEDKVALVWWSAIIAFCVFEIFTAILVYKS